MERARFNVKKGDTVIVLAGKEKGRSGRVLSVNTKKGRVFVEKINMIKRHARPSKAAPQGGIIEKESGLHASNVNLLCPKCNKAVRVKMQTLDDGKKVRACIKCSEIFDQ